MNICDDKSTRTSFTILLARVKLSRLDNFLRYTAVRIGRGTFARRVADLADDCAQAVYQIGNEYRRRRGAGTRSESETNLL